MSVGIGSQSLIMEVIAWIIISFPLLIWGQKYPVVLVPGYMASQLEADIKKENSRLWYCAKDGQNYSLWFEPLNMVPFAFDCWEENIRLSYDFKERRTKDAPGVQVRVAGFDDVASLRFSSKMNYPFSQIFNSLINALIIKGYKENVNLRAAPYDWRRAPYESGSWLVKFKDLIEKSYKENNDSPAILLCHSYGCPFINHFLSRELNQPWKDKYIRAVVGVAGAWSGTFKFLYRYMGIEHDEMVTLIFPGLLNVEKSFSSTAFLVPRPDTTWENHTLVRTFNKNYTVTDLKELVAQMNEPELMEKLKDSEKAWGPTFDPPGTELHCITGKGFPTSQSVHFDFPKPGQTIYNTWRLIYGDGDGRVSSQSMNSCYLWKDKVESEGKKFSYRELDFNHMDLIQNPFAIEEIVNLVSSIV